MIVLVAIKSRGSRAGSYIDTSQPAWVEAVAKARAAVPALRELFARREASPPFRLPLSALEDWQVELPDGSIRGGFTTQLEIALARRDGRHIPDQIARMETRFVDRLVS